MVRRVQSAREDELHKMAILHEEKLELENRLSELEQQRALQDTAGHAHCEEWEERLRGTQLGEESARKELPKPQDQAAPADRPPGRAGEEEGGAGRPPTEPGAGGAARDPGAHGGGAAGLQPAPQRRPGRPPGGGPSQKKRKAQTENKEKRLHNKIHQLEARIAELELESSTAKRRPSHSEEQTNLNRRLKELQRRHSEFRHLLLGHQAPTGTGPAFLPSSLFAPPPSAQVTEEHHLREVSQLYGRLEELESVQLHQLEELGAPAQRDQAVSGQC
ncbi:centrosomal protein of 83 kDa-like isoform X2 [Gadus morhua]|uniref:centrosomal protein of 83 kDa-like isoform X2 n=1 Tax=Gadus morhua TaxID=8049 RepID=UPI0011B364E5|nr:centrosomal protein of 83 kDa-like isoform X2 [Gadus morhua]